MSYTVTVRTLDSLAQSWADLRHLNWSSVFVLPGWLEAWWREFGAASSQHVCEIRDDREVIGLAPLKVRAGEASFIGGADVCDYMDFVVAPGKERAFSSVLLDHLKDIGIAELSLESLRPDSVALTHLADLAESEGRTVSRTAQDVSFGLELAPTWGEYLGILTSKQRHEVRRKLRRLDEAGRVGYDSVEDEDSVESTMDVFIGQFRASRSDKAAFMTPQMESFFRSVGRAMAEAGLLRLGMLSIDEMPAACVLCFDYNDTVYLYNSGYDPLYGHVSAGLLSKVLCIRDSIERGRKRFDFLKGAEEYKHHLGGGELPIYSCRIALN